MTSDALEALLQSGAAFNTWRKGCSDEIDLEGVDLRNRSVTGADLSCVNLKGASLAGAHFADTQFDEAVLYHADARQAEFSRCRFKNCYASQVNLAGSRFWQCRLEGSRFLRSVLFDVRFDHCALIRCQFDDSKMTTTRFDGSLLYENSFQGTPVEVEQNKTGRTETHLDFHWISDSGDDFALGPLVVGHPYAASVQRYQRRDEDVIKQFARMAAGVIRKHHRLHSLDTLIPVPPHSPGDDIYPNAMLARELWSQTGTKDGTNWLVRHSPVSDGADVETHRQSLVLSAAARPDRRILLLNDVVSSGATLEACRQLLLEAGARQVLSLSLAKTKDE